MKELYKFTHESEHFALDVEDMAFFQLNELGREILDCHPMLDGLHASYSSQEIQQTLEALEAAGIFTKPTATPSDIHPVLPSIAALEVASHQIGKARDFLRLYAEKHGNHAVVVRVAVDRDGRVPLEIFEIFQHGIEHFSLSITGFPLFDHLEKLHPGKVVPVELRATVDDILAPRSICSIYTPNPVMARTVVSVEYNGEPWSQLNSALRRLRDAGFKHVAIEWLCAGCLDNSPDPDDEHQSDDEMLVNSIPMGMSILTSEKICHGCGAGTRYLAASENGDLYPCRHYLDQPQFCLGNLDRGIDPMQRQKLIFPSDDRIDQCRACGVRYLCGGPTLGGRTLAINYCRIQEQLARLAMVNHSRSDLIQKAQLKGGFEILSKTLATRPYFYPREQSLPQAERERTLTVHGNSMRPLLKEGDKVLVQPLGNRTIRFGDIACFGKPVTCHRIVRRLWRNGEVMVWEKGDNSLTGSEIAAKDIDGIVTAIFKPGRTIEISSFFWRTLSYVIAMYSRMTMTLYNVFSRTRRRVKE